MLNTLSIEQLGFQLGSKTLLHPLSYRFPAGQLYTLLGPNGAGKTTLLRLLAGLASPTSGSVQFAGRNIVQLDALSRAKHIAWVAQHLPSGVPLTVWEFVGLGRQPHIGAFAKLKKQDQQLISEALNHVELSQHAKRRLESLSGGERQRAAIARALAQDTPVLLLDEPSNHLDPRHQHQLQQLLQSLAQQGKTVIQVLHELSLAASYADHILLMDQGKLVASGSAEQVLTAERLLAVYRWPLQLNMTKSAASVEKLKRFTSADAADLCVNGVY